MDDAPLHYLIKFQLLLQWPDCVMRFRIQTHAPLPDVKAWFVPDVQNVPEFIIDLKKTLCRRVQPLKDRHYHGKDLVLLLEGFELLNDSPFDAVRDGDLVTVKLSPSVQDEDENMDIQPSEVPQQRKRKRSPEQTASTSARPVRPPAVQPVLKKALVESSSDSSSEEDSDTESDSSSTSSTSSSSSSSTSTSSDSSSTTPSSPPKPRSSNAVVEKPASTKPTPAAPTGAASTVHVPPGQGKATTHSRNERRKKKREFEKLALAPPKGLSETNTIPLGTSTVQKDGSPPSSSAQDRRDLDGPAPDVAGTLNNAFQSNASGPQYEQQPQESQLNDNSEAAPTSGYITLDQVAMGSLRNKNKKKGFKLSMNAPIPQKIIFNAEAGPSSLSSYSTTESGTPTSYAQAIDYLSTSGPTHPIPPATSQCQARLVPPSEIQKLGLLPPNMFVMSVDVEAGVWDDPSTSRKSKRNNRKNKSRAQKYWYGHEEEQVSEEYSYGEQGDGGVGAVEQEAGKNSCFDWNRADKVWENCAALQSVEQLAVGNLVGWKALDINPKTFSPELMLSVGRVASILQDTTPKVTVRQLIRPTESEAALAFGLGGGTASEGGVEDGEPELSCAWDEILQAGWKLIDL
ncbi:unnamed protein product [Cyclocybe aegerita]|uniref:Coilin n=1 Tax=Cyclocybe aegerita TaxID=1973307 RepID=A0A8S0XR48_CYCAE|nr:unnamed protein product [Cyclocybe aegerita]